MYILRVHDINSGFTQIMTSHKALALLCCLLCFCFLSTSYAQPCLVETHLTNSIDHPLVLDDLPESYRFFTTIANITPVVYLSLIIKKPTAKNRLNYFIPSASRGPP